LGQAGGEAQHTLTAVEMPVHAHALRASGKVAASTSPNPGILAAPARTGTLAYATAASLVPLNPASITTVSGGQPHENRPPLLAMNFTIALQGIFPSRNWCSVSRYSALEKIAAVALWQAAKRGDTARYHEDLQRRRGVIDQPGRCAR
jgi:hypothetical protein